MKSKTILKASMWYFIFAMVFGVFYREATKLTNFTGKTTLSVVHAHTIVLGTILFLILFVLSVSKNFGQGSLFSKFFKTYNIALPFMIIMLIVRGVTQVFNLVITSTQSAIISGISGLAHIFMLVAFIMLFRCLFQFCKELEK